MDLEADTFRIQFEKLGKQRSKPSRSNSLERFRTNLTKKKMHCKNCGHTIDGNYCSQCGQKSDVSRITFAAIAQEISESIFQVNRGLFFTIKELFLRPGQSIDDFLHGKRKNHFKPIAYVLTLSTLYFLVTKLTGQNTYLDDFIAGLRSGVSETTSGFELLDIVTWLAQNYAYAALLLLPVFSLASYLAFFGFGKNYLEHIVLNSYVTGQQAIFYAVFAIGGKLIDYYILELFPFMFSIGYAYWVFWQFFSRGSRWGNLLRSTASYLMFLLFNSVFFLLIAFVVR
jgi:hypothetical protein